MPHGKEWKKEFKILLNPFLELNIFPEDIRQCIGDYAVNPRATACADISLMKVFKKYDLNSEFVHLEDLPENSIFKLKNGRAFIKGKLLRKRYLCIDPSSRKKYLVSAVAEVNQTSLF